MAEGNFIGGPMYLAVKKLSAKGEFESPFATKGVYIKAVPYVGNEWFDEPTVGNRYGCCRMLTSNVESYMKAENGWLIETEHSSYLYFLSESMEDLEEMAKRDNLTNKEISLSGATYWRSA